MIAEVRPTEDGDAEVIAADLRAVDVDELWASNRTTGAECMAYGRRYSGETWTGTFDGVPVCMFGAVPASLLGGVGVPWMVGTTALNRMRGQKALLRASRATISGLSARYSVLANLVDARNGAAIRWLRWLGFDVLPPIPHGPDRLPFHPFILRG